ncbi:hypothetical protein FK531_14735 [Rhodococcus spelaei]|uniref:Secreted protein n=1 Tax=Rhodococcus spelaei TaxID=2546320 RepID=A0A541B7N9_9NOCA|nr:hypothetical protein [Rhodococcus spelaei]TQF68342.1 hypothetical protein FK531_14735 [Rhodococcus spelaei]
MIDFVRRAITCAAIAAGSVLAPAAIASAAVTVPFQINPAPFGNPNGSFDAPAVRCVAVVGEQPGTVTITGSEEGRREGRWACQVRGDVYWLNLSTGAAGSARMSLAQYGYPAAILSTGTGQVVLTVIPEPGTTTPGFVTVYVP